MLPTIVRAVEVFENYADDLHTLLVCEALYALPHALPIEEAITTLIVLAKDYACVGGAYVGEIDHDSLQVVWATLGVG